MHSYNFENDDDNQDVHQGRNPSSEIPKRDSYDNNNYNDQTTSTTAEGIEKAAKKRRCPIKKFDVELFRKLSDDGEVQKDELWNLYNDLLKYRGDKFVSTKGILQKNEQDNRSVFEKSFSILAPTKISDGIENVEIQNNLKRSSDIKKDLNLLIRLIHDWLDEIYPCNESLRFISRKIMRLSMHDQSWQDYRYELLLKYKNKKIKQDDPVEIIGNNLGEIVQFNNNFAANNNSIQSETNSKLDFSNDNFTKNIYDSIAEDFSESSQIEFLSQNDKAVDSVHINETEDVDDLKNNIKNTMFSSISKDLMKDKNFLDVIEEKRRMAKLKKMKHQNVMLN